MSVSKPRRRRILHPELFQQQNGLCAKCSADLTRRYYVKQAATGQLICRPCIFDFKKTPKRNLQIAIDYFSGKHSVVQLASIHNVSYQRICQIISKLEWRLDLDSSAIAKQRKLSVNKPEKPEIVLTPVERQSISLLQSYLV